MGGRRAAGSPLFFRRRPVALKERVKAAAGARGVVGDGTPAKMVCVKQGDLRRGETGAGVRALIVVTKRSNVRGAKGGRKAEA